MELVERERPDTQPVEVDKGSEDQVAVGRVILARDQALAGPLSEAPADWDQGPVAEVSANWDQGLVDLVAEVPRVGVRAQADQVVGDRAVERKRGDCGPELATTAARALFRGWSPALREELLPGVVTRRKKSFLGFSEH